MSKFLPMFKKKGKGKEEEMLEETKKKRSKSNKVSKEILSSPSSSVVSKAEKKRKSTKRKAPTPQGKENYPSVQELEKEFFIDASGVVRECPSELYIDAAGAVREGPRELFIDNALAVDDSNTETISDTSHEDCLLAREKQENGSPQSDDCISENAKELKAENNVAGSVSNLNSSCEETTLKTLESSMENQEKRQVHQAGGDLGKGSEENGDECVVLRSSRKSENDDSLSAKLASRLSVSEELQHWQEEEAVVLDFDPISDSTEDLKKEAEATDEKILENFHDVDTDNSVSVPLVSAVDVGDDHLTVRIEEHTVAEAEVGEEMGLSVAHEDSLVETFYTNTPESDDDFDSAQEDWDEESAEEKEPKINPTNLLQNEDFEASSGSERVAEAENEEMKDRYEAQVSRHASTTSSVYQDAHSRENSLYDINSIIEATNENHSSGEGVVVDSGQANKLTRKISNVSASSSDIFNEELDDLLNEELDRLSEEESGSTALNDTILEGNNEVVTEMSGADSTSQLQQLETITETEKSLPNLPHPENTEIAAQEDPKTAAPEKEESVEVVPAEESKNTSDQLDKESIDNTDNPKSQFSESTGHTAVQDKISSENNIAEESVVTDPAAQAASEGGLDQAKDSGYYSLPVSPKPNTVTEKEREQAAAESSVPQESQKENKEEELTPPSEMTVATTESEEAPEVKKVLLENSVPDKPSEPCTKSNESSSFKTVNGLATVKEENMRIESTEMSPKVEEKKKPKLDTFKSPMLDFKGTASSPGPSGPVPGRLSRHKSPGLGGDGKHSDEGMLSPDPVGDMFLQQAVCLSHEEAEARLAQRRAARAEARELRLRELEKQQHEQDNEEEKQFASPSHTEPVPRAGLGRAAGRSTGMNCSGQYSRRSSEDSTTDEASLPANVREMRTELKELDEKFRKAMITNAQLDNEKATLTFEVELMKDKYTELEEVHTQLTKEHRKKCTEYEQLKKVSMKLQEEVKILRSMLQERDQLIQEYGLVVMGEEENGEDVDHAAEEDDDVDDLSPRKLSVKKVLVSQEVGELLSKGAARGSLDVRLKKFCEEKNDLEDQVRRLKLELEEERSESRRRENGLDYEKQKEQSKTVNEYKFRVQKAEAEVSTLQANVARLDALSNRYKTQSEELEKSEEELKLEKRKLQRELRDAQSRLEELETTNNHLIKRFDKLKNARSNLLKDLSQDPA
ncbi:myosin-11-like isoform X2 [Eriocheir sinensis]|uniref:myosin-11-like isoform X2 n=1 Tax=Eriocheir sinensis TaxID=95602 RepID=UPI0021C8540D|nr:myosin-11-like isoform X2 [Eriocheir sinensis]